MNTEPLQSTVDAKEIEKFSKIANEWWDPNGKFKPLHRLNPTRLKYIKHKIEGHFKEDINTLSLLDIGCGGGLIAEPCARMGFQVTAIDASEKNINIASTHAEETNTDITYKCTTIEELTNTKQQFDIVLALEIIEHVEDADFFLEQCIQAVKPGGIIILSTINKTAKSYLFAIMGAEYILRWLPIGTHSWHKFIPPAHIGRRLQKNNITLSEVKGVSFNLFNQSWDISKDTSVNYMLVGTKPKE